MGKNDCVDLIVESFIPSSTSGRHGLVHIRSVPGQKFSPSLFVECSKSLCEDYPVGTKFKIKAKLKTRLDGGSESVYSHYKWKYEVLAK